MFLTKDLFEQANLNKSKEPWATFYNATMLLADKLLEEVPPRVEVSRHNWILEQARCFVRYTITLAGAYCLTQKTAYAQKCWELMEDSFGWEHWYWNHESSGGYQFDLTTGEMAYAFSMLLIMLSAWLNKEQRKKTLYQLDQRILSVYTKATSTNNHKGKPAHWYTWKTNWNAVCNGGMLCLAFTLAEDNRYKELIPIGLNGLSYYLDNLHEDGSSVEGIGYWNYGVSYMTYALLCYWAYYEKPHPVLLRQVFQKGLSFPFDFSPNGVGISFGDVNDFSPSPIIYTLATEAKRQDIENEITKRLLGEDLLSTPVGASSCDLVTRELFALLFCKQGEELRKANNKVAIYPDNGWAAFFCNGLNLSFRAGSTKEPHAVKDLNSIQLAKGKEILLENIANRPYTLGWFGEGRELYTENQTQTKNAVLINGCGQLTYAQAQWSFLQKKNKVVSDAEAAYPDYVKKVERSISLEEDYICVTDSIKTEGKAWHETRWITHGTFTQGSSHQWLLQKGEEKAVLTFEANTPICFVVSELPNSIGNRKSATMLRVLTENPVGSTIVRCRIS